MVRGDITHLNFMPVDHSNQLMTENMSLKCCMPMLHVWIRVSADLMKCDLYVPDVRT